MKSNDDHLPFSLDVLSLIGKAAIPGIFPRNQKPDMLLGKAVKTHEAKALSPLSPAYKVDSFLGDYTWVWLLRFCDVYKMRSIIRRDCIFFIKQDGFSVLLVTPDLSKLR